MYTYTDVHVPVLLSEFAPPSPSLTVSTLLFSVCLYSCPANKFISTISMDIVFILMHVMKKIFGQETWCILKIDSGVFKIFFLL